MTRRDLLLARVAASAIFFGNGFGIGTWAAQLPRFKGSLGLSDGQLSLGLLAFSLGAVALMPVIGWAVAFVGSRTMSLIAAFSFAAALLLPGLAPSLPLFVAAALVAGACNGTMDIAMNTNATVVEKAWGSAIMSSFHAFSALGGLAGAARPACSSASIRDRPDAPHLLPRHGPAFLVAGFGSSVRRTGPPTGHGFACPGGPSSSSRCSPCSASSSRAPSSTGRRSISRPWPERARRRPYRALPLSPRHDHLPLHGRFCRAASVVSASCSWRLRSAIGLAPGDGPAAAPSRLHRFRSGGHRLAKSCLSCSARRAR